MRTLRFTGGRKPVRLGPPGTPECHCAAMKAEVQAGAYEALLWSFEAPGFRPVRVLTYAAVALGDDPDDREFAPRCPYCGGEMGQTERLLNAFGLDGAPGKRSVADLRRMA